MSGVDNGNGHVANTFSHIDADNEGISISLDTDMIDEDEMMAMQADDDGEGEELGEIVEDPDATTGAKAPDNLMMNKVFIQGLDNMSTGNVKDFVALYYPAHTFEKLEWINDSSLNIVFADETIAGDALSAFTTEIGRNVPCWQLRESKRSESHPLARLEVRIAAETDRKEKGARERSRYYLFNPEEDRVEQQERRRRENPQEHQGRNKGRGGYRERDYSENYRDRSQDGDNSDYRRRHYDAEEDSRRVQKSTYDENFYEDTSSAPKKEPIELFPNGPSGKGSRQPTRSKSPIELFPHKLNKPKNVELFPEKLESRGSRRRSASPSSYRLPTPPRILVSTETIPEPPRRGQSPPRSNTRGRHVAPDTTTTTTTTTQQGQIELFPEKLAQSSQPTAAKSFAERISFGSNNNGADLIQPMDNSPDAGFSIRGNAANKGFSIRGAAAGGQGGGDLIQPVSANAGIELLPGKNANGLFSRIDESQNNRKGNRRRRAEDMFG